MAKARSEDFKAPICRISYAQSLFKPRAQQEGGTEKYGCTLIYPKSVDRSALDGALRKVIVEEWGEKGLERAKARLIKSPFLAGDGKEARNKQTGEIHPGLGPDFFFIRVSSIRQPVLRFRSPTIPATEEEIYSGCYGFAVLNAFAWHNPQNGDGVSFGIQYFQKTGDGERLGGGGGIDVDKYFEKIADEGVAPAETRTGEGAAGLFS